MSVSRLHEPDGRFTRQALAADFNVARHNGTRYVGVVQETDLHSAVRYRQKIIFADDCIDIVRQVRDVALRPDARSTLLYQLFDTREDFDVQEAYGPLSSVGRNLTDDARAAYLRLLDAQMEHAGRHKKPRGVLSRLLR